MDSLTHIVLGAAIGEAMLGKKIGRKAMLWGALADTIPDFDVFAAPCFSQAQQLLIHRGITHSFFFVIIGSLLFGTLWHRWNKRAAVTRREWILLFFAGLFSHILLDSLTAYGTGWFEPFSSYRVSFHTIFVADPFYTLPFLVCVIVALIAANNSEKRKKWNRAGLVISSLYLLFTIINHFYVYGVIGNSFTKNNLEADHLTVTPTALNNFLWYGFSHDSTGTSIGYYSIFDKSKDVKFYHLDRKDYLLKPYENERDIILLKRFSKGDYVITTHDSALYFNDLRFGQMGGWDHPDSAFVFSFRIDKKSGEKALNRSRFKTSVKDALQALVRRIGGR